MIAIGLTGWGDHDAIYPPKTKPVDKLAVYSQHYQTVEVDSSFYAVQSAARFAAWVGETPPQFRFLVKAYQGMTGHLRGKPYFETDDQMYEAFLASLSPVIEAGKLSAVLFQYPPWFDCTRDNVMKLRETKRRMGGIPCALEFRHQSWFSDDYRRQTLDFMQREAWIHSICDEPQAGTGSVPTVLEATSEELTIIRLHGRNTAGWNQGGADNWREVRYLYHYSLEELTEWKQKLEQLSAETRRIDVIFNNNSGGHAAGNAVSLMDMLGLRHEHSPRMPWEIPDETPEQLDLFELE